MIRFNLPSLIGCELDDLQEAVVMDKLSISGPFANWCSDILSGSPNDRPLVVNDTADVGHSHVLVDEYLIRVLDSLAAH